MNREEILAKAQKETDERELTVKNKAYRHASEVMTAMMAVLALYLVVDGYILENVRQFSSMTFGTGIVGIYCIYLAVYEAYVGYHLKDKKSIFGVISVLLIASAMLKTFLGGIL